MYSYIKGIVNGIEPGFIELDNNGIGYKINTPTPHSFKLLEECKLYVYEHIREDEHSIYGFKTKEEKELFLKLINVKGLGPKMALPMLALGSISGIADAINRENILYLKKFPKIGEKVAKQIILDLKGKLETSDALETELDDVAEALKALGYKQNDIVRVLSMIDKTKKIEDQIKEALKLLLK